LLINFWATWCAPCREEFPDLVKIGTDYKGKIDLITVSLDELSEINGEVPKFLAQMKSESPCLSTKNAGRSAAIELVSKDWQGALPFTILFNAQGETIYSKQGKFKTDVLVAEIEKTFNRSKPDRQSSNHGITVKSRLVLGFELRKMIKQLLVVFQALSFLLLAPAATVAQRPTDSQSTFRCGQVTPSADRHQRLFSHAIPEIVTSLKPMTS
jgi:thiol-disulfide isomerase/thioredoxin